MRLLFAISTVFLLSACYAHHPTTVKVDGVGEVRYGTSGHGNFCPPGQARKGNC